LAESFTPHIERRMLGRVAMVAAAIEAVATFCIDRPNVTNGSDVILTWVQAPLFSTIPRIGNTTRRLDLFHTAIVFRQELVGGDEKYWTLEFDILDPNITRHFGSILPLITDGSFKWVADARWCLREGLYNGRAHWTKSYVDVASISSDQFLHILHDYIPAFNSSVPGAWPQYQFFRVQDILGNRIIDDLTCSHVYRIIQYVRDGLHVPVKDMVFKATRVTMRVVDMFAERTSSKNLPWLVQSFYTSLHRAISRKIDPVDKMLALFEFFLPEMFMHDNNRGQYYSVVAATPLPGMLFLANYEEIGEDLPPHQPPKTPECGVSMKCFAEMKKVCHWGGGLPCNVCLDTWYPYLTLVKGCPLVESLLSAQACFCGEVETLV
jgi:hypothetical protein